MIRLYREWRLYATAAGGCLLCVSVGAWLKWRLGAPDYVLWPFLALAWALGFAAIAPVLCSCFLDALSAILDAASSFPETYPGPSVSTVSCHCGEIITMPSEGNSSGCNRCGCVLLHNQSGLGYQSCEAGRKIEILEAWRNRTSRPCGPEEEPFVSAIGEGPEDNASRLVYADWLEERGDGLRAEYLRLECELAGLPKEDERFVPLQTGLTALRSDLHSQWSDWLALVNRPTPSSPPRY